MLFKAPLDIGAYTGVEGMITHLDDVDRPVSQFRPQFKFGSN